MTKAFVAATPSRFYAPVALGIWLANWELDCAALGRAGRFATLSAAERGADHGEGPPVYDVSWIAEAV